MDSFVLVVGGINFDIKAKSSDKLLLGDSNPGRIHTSSGGVGRNIAHNLALLGIPVKFISAVGNDSQASYVLDETASAGVDVSNVKRLNDYDTGTYIALIDNNGEMVAALSSMEVFEQITPDFLSIYIDIILKASFIVCDCNIPKDTIAFLIKIANKNNIPICVEPVSSVKAARVIDILDGIDYITPNTDELNVLAGTEKDAAGIENASNKLIKKGVKAVIATSGENGICYTDMAGSVSKKCLKTEVIDVTGAGDSLTAGFIYGIIESGNTDYACSCGLAAAAITIASKETVSSNLKKENIKELIF